MSKYQADYMSYKDQSLLAALATKIIRPVLSLIDEPRFKKIASGYNFNSYERIYNIHIRKTGGTSLNHMFLSLADQDNHGLYNRISASLQKRIEAKGKIFVGHNRVLINRGNYFYAYSHMPIYKLNLPQKTFTLVCFRDPVKRVASLYNMLLEIKRSAPSHPLAKTEGSWLGENFEDFLSRVPKADLLNQLYMFSGKLIVADALTEAKKVNHIMFCENFPEGTRSLSLKTGLHLEPIHTRKTEYKEVLSRSSLKKLQVILEPEYEFLGQVMKYIESKFNRLSVLAVDE